ncbi:glycine cleavage H-protein [Thermocrinis albus DSM 14484]|uniref:Glycine cleavage H-protein n=1 Tax=Thermocrinis albus (strain DSM 14484 / JCM 11386 / HI 11/12) TaxID=638303 RepID=D3SLG7_THEAH|nr:glycine cleavage system protein H [Thermocrinis albus]ADC89597.1 glycine cleavage H-protein [Thermocrinis albus DSM 14484]
MDYIEVLGCKIKKDRLYRINEERMIFQWVKREGKSVYSVGFTPILAYLIYPVYAIKLKPVGTKVEYDGNLAVIEAGKRVLTFPSPLTGTVVEVNGTLERDPSPIVADPYGAWLVKIESTDVVNLRKLRKAQDVVEIFRKVIIREDIECLPRS